MASKSKALLHAFGSAIGVVVGKILPKGVFKVSSIFCNSIYSGWIRASLASCGNNFEIYYPMTYTGLQYIKIGNNFRCFSRLRLEAYDRHNDVAFQPSIVIGDNVSINYDCHIACVNKISIGDNVLIASKVFITDHFHGDMTLDSLHYKPADRTVLSKGPVTLENNVWVGEGACIMPNIVIGANSIVGANSVVTKSFPENSVIGGVPARLLKTIE